MCVHLKQKKKWICNSIRDHNTPVIMLETHVGIDRAATETLLVTDRSLFHTGYVQTTTLRLYFIPNGCTLTLFSQPLIEVRSC